MQRLPLILATFALFAAACSSTPIAETSDTLPGTSATESSEPEEPVQTTASSSSPVLDGPVAPDFVLPLEPSGSFVLSQEVKPVYMVFWAEW
ncbi:MAG: hypothetical protein ABFR53_08885 [Actinomycetota bacterium]